MENSQKHSHQEDRIDPDFKENLRRVFHLQQENRYRVAQTSARERIKKLKRLQHWILENRERIREALYRDFRKPPAETDLTEIYVVLSEIKHAIRHLKKWMKPRRVRPTRALLTTRAWIRYEPRGVVLIISPWNFPFNLTFGPFVSALAAGNCIIVKPSEYSFHTSRLMKQMVEELFPPQEAYLFEGDQRVARELLTYPFDHIMFTGSPVVGKEIMKAAAEHLTTVTLELGGKSPVIVDETANVDDAVQKIAWGKYMNKGQTCIAPDYLLVHRKIYPEFMQKLKDFIKQTYGSTEEERLRNPNYSRIISSKHHQRLVQMLRFAVAQGAHLEMGGKAEEMERYIDPTIITDVPLDSPLMQEEIFGPILPVIPFEELSEVYRIIRQLEKPLALYIFSNSKQNIAAILENTTSGGVCVNDVVLHFLHLNLPFGGINNSGHGNAHGYYGFKAFSHERAVLKHSRFSPMKLMYPPYTRRVQRLIELLLRYF